MNMKTHDGLPPLPPADGEIAQVRYWNISAMKDYARAAVESAAAPQPPKLNAIEQYRMQMAGISTAALGYWKEGDSIAPEYDTQALRDVARLYAKYAELKAAPQPAQAALSDERESQTIAQLRKSLLAWQEECNALRNDRDILRQRIDLQSLHQKNDVWYWQGDGTDHPESISNSMAIVIRGDQLRAILAASHQPAAAQQEINAALDRADAEDAARYPAAPVQAAVVPDEYLAAVDAVCAIYSPLSCSMKIGSERRVAWERLFDARSNYRDMLAAAPAAPSPAPVQAAVTHAFAHGAIAALAVLSSHGHTHGSVYHDEVVKAIGETEIYAAAEDDDYELSGLDPSKKPINEVK